MQRRQSRHSNTAPMIATRNADDLPCLYVPVHLQRPGAHPSPPPAAAGDAGPGAQDQGAYAGMMVLPLDVVFLFIDHFIFLFTCFFYSNHN